MVSTVPKLGSQTFLSTICRRKERRKFVLCAKGFLVVCILPSDNVIHPTVSPCVHDKRFSRTNVKVSDRLQPKFDSYSRANKCALSLNLVTCIWLTMLSCAIDERIRVLEGKSGSSTRSRIQICSRNRRELRKWQRISSRWSWAAAVFGGRSNWKMDMKFETVNDFYVCFTSRLHRTVTKHWRGVTGSSQLHLTKFTTTPCPE